MKHVLCSVLIAGGFLNTINTAPTLKTGGSYDSIPRKSLTESMGGTASGAKGTDIVVTDGYMDKISYYPGEVAMVYINAEEEVEGGTLRLYSASGLEMDQVICNARQQLPTRSEPWRNGFGYDVTFEYEIPDLRSGYYRWDNKIPFIIKSDHEDLDVIVVYPSNTLYAYTTTGGKSLYHPLNDPAQRVSFLRPENHGDWLHISFYEWLEEQSQYDVGFVCDSDLDDFSEMERSRLLVITGHNEYWTRKARENFDRYVDEGNDALVLSGNTMWWQVRYDEGGTQLICHKYWFEPDPIEDPLLRTVQWNDPSLQYPIVQSIGADFDHGGYGKKLDDAGWNGYLITAPESPLLEGTGLQEGEILSLPTAEYDGAPVVEFDERGYPVLDTTLLGFHKLELIGFDLCAVETDPDRIATFIVFQKSYTSGIVVNGASTNWCGKSGIGRNEDIEKITTNMFDKLLSNADVFSPPEVVVGTSEKIFGPFPNSLALHQNYPNPFNPSTTLRYSLPTRSEVTLTIYDMLGRTVRTLARGLEEPGHRTVAWDGTDDRGRRVNSGVYFYQISAGSFGKAGRFTQTRKALLLR